MGNQGCILFAKSCFRFFWKSETCFMWNKNVVIHFKWFQRWLLYRINVSNWIMLDLRFAWFKIIILTLIIKRGIRNTIRISNLKNAPQVRGDCLECSRLWVWTWSGQFKDYMIGICCFSAKHAALRSKNKDWLTRNQDNVSEWADMSIRGLLFQWASTIKIQQSVLTIGLVQRDLIIVSLKINLFSSWNR